MIHDQIGNELKIGDRVRFRNPYGDDYTFTIDAITEDFIMDSYGLVWGYEIPEKDRYYMDDHGTQKRNGHCSNYCSKIEAMEHNRYIKTHTL